MAEFHPVRETLFFATAVILAGGIVVLVFPGDREVGGFIVLLVLLFAFVAMTLYLTFRLLYGRWKERP